MNFSSDFNRDFLFPCEMHELTFHGVCFITTSIDEKVATLACHDGNWVNYSLEIAPLPKQYQQKAVVLCQFYKRTIRDKFPIDFIFSGLLFHKGRCLFHRHVEYREGCNHIKINS